MADPAKDSAKKRKRHTEDGNKPSKKVAIQAPSSVKNVRVEVVPRTQEWAPIVVSTPGLSLPKTIVLEPYVRRRKNAPVRPAESGYIATNELLVQSSDHPSIDYLGHEAEAGSADSLLKHYVGAYDPATSTLQIMEARKMVVRGTVRSHEAAPESMEEKEIMTHYQLRNELGQAFGTKKARKAIAAVTENAISNRAQRGTPQPLDSAASILLDTMAEAAGGVASREELAAVVDEAKPRPKPNLAAENVRDVYPLSSLVGEDILKLVPVKEWQDLVREKKEIFTNSRYVSRRVVQIANTGDVRKLRALRYLLALLDFFNASQVKGRGIRMVKPKEALRAAMPNIPEAVVENIRRKFSDGGQISRFHTDLLITHVCALALVVENFEVDTYELREDLKLEVKEITQYFRELGARVVAAGEEVRKKLDLKSKAAAAQHKIAKLKLPLDFPKAKFSRRK